MRSRTPKQTERAIGTLCDSDNQQQTIGEMKPLIEDRVHIQEGHEQEKALIEGEPIMQIAQPRHNWVIVQPADAAQVIEPAVEIHLPAERTISDPQCDRKQEHDEP